MLLSEYDIKYRTQKAIKSSVLADYLAHQPVEDHQSTEYEFPDEDVMLLKTPPQQIFKCSLQQGLFPQ